MFVLSPGIWFIIITFIFINMLAIDIFINMFINMLTIFVYELAILVFIGVNQIHLLAREL